MPDLQLPLSPISASPSLNGEGVTLTRKLPGGQQLTYMDLPPGAWLTKAGEPAKKAKRGYTLDGEPVESVSRIADQLRKEALEMWLEREAAAGAVQAHLMGELEGCASADIYKRVRALGLGPAARREEAADRGSIVHAALHTLATTGVAPNPSQVPVTARPWLQGAMRAWIALDVAEVVEAEQPIANPVHLYAGRPDLVVRTGDGRVTLVDWKSGRGRVFPEAHFQTRLYAMALAHCGVEVERILIVGVNDSGGFELVDCSVSEREAEALLTVARARQRVTREMDAQRRLTAKLAKGECDG